MQSLSENAKQRTRIRHPPRRRTYSHHPGYHVVGPATGGALRQTHGERIRVLAGAEHGPSPRR
eukprot:6007956-Lingulodinium_polyedra.AAC.1